MEFRLLGPVEVHHDGRRLPAGSGRERFVLAMLLLNAGRQVTGEYLVDRLWGAEPPASARAQLHNLMSKLRTRLHEVDAGLIVTRPSGYELRLGRHRLDVAEFHQRVAEARQATARNDHQAAIEALTEALAQWRGAPLTDVPGGLGGDIRHGLAEERLAAAEAKLDAELALGRYDTVIRDVQPLLADHPYREHLYNGLMHALAGAGRRADALATYQTAYRRFADDLGVEPGPALRELEQRILRGEPTNAPPSGTTAHRLVPRQLPPAGERITGRDELLGTVVGALSEGGSSVVVLVGPGGVGKTTLALAAGHRLAAGVLDDGQLYADLRGSQGAEYQADPHEVAGRFLRALGVDGLAVPEDADERIAMYRSHLAERRVLIVLDDAAGEAQVRPLLPGAGGSGVIVTSRRQLAALMGTRRIVVPELVNQDALDLLARVGGAQVSAGQPAARRIVELCGGLPLAVCIAGARLAAQPEWTADELARRLETERERLNVLTVGDLDVRASIALSYQALDAETARLFRLLGRRPATTDWPAWVADAAYGAPARHLLRQLIDIHLVQPQGTDPLGQDRYRLHDLVAAYAAEQPEAEQEQAGAARRTVEGWLSLASEADEGVEHGMTSALGLPVPPHPEPAMHPTGETAFDWFETERANLLAALGQADRLGDADLTARLALRTGGFLQLRAYDSDRIRAYELAAAGLRRTQGPADLLLRVLSGLLAAYSDGAAYERMAEVSAEQLALARQTGDRQRIIRALAQSGHTARVLGRLDEAAERLDEAYDRCDDETPSQLKSTVMAYRASTFLESGQAAAAEPWIGRAVAVEREHGRPLILAWRLMTQADVLAALGRELSAADALHEAMRAAERVDDALTVASVEVKLAGVEIVLGRADDAEERLRRALAVTEELGDAEMTGDALRSLGDLAVARGEPGQAVKPLRESLARWRRLGRPLEIARVLARLDRLLGDAPYRTEWRQLLADLGLDETSLRLPAFYAQQ